MTEILKIFEIFLSLKTSTMWVKIFDFCIKPTFFAEKSDFTNSEKNLNFLKIFAKIREKCPKFRTKSLISPGIFNFFQ